MKKVAKSKQKKKAQKERQKNNKRIGMPLPEEALKLASQVWNDPKCPMDTVFVEGNNSVVRRRDLLKLKNNDWLNDELINSFLGLLIDRAVGDIRLPKVHIFTTFFFASLTSKGYAGVKRWTKHVDLFSKDLILFPIHQAAHWTLMSIDLRKREMIYYDSMHRSGSQFFPHLSSYLSQESLQKRSKEMDWSGWKIMERTDIPEQRNGSDCGVFMCRFAECITRGGEINFDQLQMPYFRKRMLYEICRQQLMQEEGGREVPNKRRSYTVGLPEEIYELADTFAMGLGVKVWNKKVPPRFLDAVKRLGSENANTIFTETTAVQMEGGITFNRGGKHQGSSEEVFIYIAWQKFPELMGSRFR